MASQEEESTKKYEEYEEEDAAFPHGIEPVTGDGVPAFKPVYVRKEERSTIIARQVEEDRVANLEEERAAKWKIESIHSVYYPDENTSKLFSLILTLIFKKVRR